jgi:FixJ family two-component response regulator
MACEYDRTQSDLMPKTKTALIGIVDDEEAIRDSVSSLVRSAGFRARTFPTAESFLESDHPHATDCMILDVQMPGMNGLELQRRLADMRCPIPIIFATAHADSKVQNMALEHGAVAFLQKPFSDDALFHVLEKALT